MAGTLQRATPAQILGRAHRQMVEALEGRTDMLDVCGLGIEDLRLSIIAECSEMLSRCGDKVLCSDPGSRYSLPSFAHICYL